MVLYLPQIKLTLTKTDKIDFLLVPSLLYTVPLITPTSHFSCHFSCHFSDSDANKDLTGFEEKFTGHSLDTAIMPYHWQMLKKNNLTALKIQYIEDPQLVTVVAIIDASNQHIDVTLFPRNETRLSIDPLFQPLGSLLMVYLAHYTGGFLIHASGAYHNNKGHIFTAVSGTGKSTMAGLWKDSGANIINDDRLWLIKLSGKWHMFNTPMIWYAQEPLMAPVNNIFLIRQDTSNSINQLKGLNAAMKVMSNCIQHLYDKTMTATHLERVLDFTSNTPIYDCGFNLDGRIVEIINELT
jgi:hypothetical protein